VAVHVSLAALWMDSGLVPRAVIGQSPRRDRRARAYRARSPRRRRADHHPAVRAVRADLWWTGGIASIRLSAKDIEPFLSAYDGRLEIAGDMGRPDGHVAGDLVPLEHMVTVLNGRASSDRDPASIPSHCSPSNHCTIRLTMRGAIRPGPTQIPMYST